MPSREMMNTTVTLYLQGQLLSETHGKSWIAISKAFTSSNEVFRRWLAHNPEIYPEPETFKPERYIDAEGNFSAGEIDPNKYAFGYGRRSEGFLTFIISSSRH
jgi:hypothetical protein